MSAARAWVRDPAAAAGSWDVVVIGAGITGIQSALELAARGYSVLVCDKGDLGAGTSSATTKYIHGGLRYLEQGDVATVAESIRERRGLALAAPHLVVPRRFVLPVWDWTTPRRAVLAAGLAAYEVLALGRNRGLPPAAHAGRATWLDRRATLAAAPWLRPEGLKGAFAYYDMLNVHPERLLLAIARTAVDLGATILTHAQVGAIATEPAGEGVRVTGVTIADARTGATTEVRARVVVNAAGPWADLALGPLAARVGLRVKRAKGIHLLTRALGGTDAVFTRTRSGRHVVVSPWQGFSFIGPTDTVVAEGPDAVAVTPDDIEGLVTAVADISTDVPGMDDLHGATVGVRPLIADGAADSYTTSRGHRLHDHRGTGVAGLLSVTGGKWTTGRKVGEDVAHAVGRILGEGRPRDAARPPLHGSLPEPERERLVRALAADGRIAPEVAAHLVRLYGADAAAIGDLVRADPALAAPAADGPRCRDILAQAVHAVTAEGAATLADVLHRRLVLGTLGRVTDAEARRVAAVIAPLLGWDAERTEAEVAGERARTTTFDAAVAAWAAGRQATARGA
ncbi:MAG: FAD-dependent oxidoreductase [Chloroflexota bacterium]